MKRFVFWLSGIFIAGVALTMVKQSASKEPKFYRPITIDSAALNKPIPLPATGYDSVVIRSNKKSTSNKNSNKNSDK